MRLLNCILENFASYKSLEFDFENQGLALVYGATGSGKSTLQDAACWVLFGATAKDGPVDDVRAWDSDEATIGCLKVDTASGPIAVTRVRGKAQENDLYWFEVGDASTKKRGKDLNDTQKLLNSRLGVDYDLYCTAAYFNEFSPTSQFFLSKPKDRRATLERVANLEMPKLLAERTSDARKEARKTLEGARDTYARGAGRLDQLVSLLRQASQEEAQWGEKHSQEVKRLEARVRDFEKTKAEEVADLEEKLSKFEEDRQKKIDRAQREVGRLEGQLSSRAHDDLISKLSQEAKCQACGSLKSHVQDKIQAVREDKAKNQQILGYIETATTGAKVAEEQINPYKRELKRAKGAQNALTQVLSEARAKTNPFVAQVSKWTKDVTNLQEEYEASKILVDSLERRVNGLTQLYDLSFEVRGAILRRAVAQIEESTNSYLERFFDAEFRVSFELKNADELEVFIYKSGHSCHYKQLSKGQRGLLKLCFVSAVMSAAANKAGVHFSQLFFDESLDGLDAELKVKAYRLFEDLCQHRESVFVIDHSQELQALFSKRYHVTLVGDHSEIEEESS